MSVDTSQELWQQGCARLAAELPEQQFDTWIRPLSLVAEGALGGDGVVAVQVPNRFKLDWIRSQFAGRIEHARIADWIKRYQSQGKTGSGT